MLPRGLLKEYSQILSLIMRVLDVCAVVGSGIGAYYYRFGHLDFPQRYIAALIVAALMTFIVFPSFHLYESARAKGFWQNIQYLIKAVGTVVLLLAGLAFLTKTGENFSRAWFITTAIFTVSLLILFRCTLLIFLRLMRSHGWNERRIIIIGAGGLTQKLVETVQQSLWTGFRIIAIFDDQIIEKQALGHIPVLPTPNNIDSYLAAQKELIDEIWLTLPLTAEDRVKELLHDLRHQTLPIRFVLDTFGANFFAHSMADLAGFPALNLNYSPMVGMNRLVKAIEDRVLAFFILIFISPLLLLISIGIKISSKGPVFFKQRRHGWDGCIIKIYKFRTMVEHQEQQGIVTQATQNDTRITPLGKFLRRTSLDELPQFINVLQGRMSIVGPRPHAVSHNEFYKDSIEAYMQRHKVKPGITGWAQVNGWRGETETLEKMQKRVEFDLYYIENWSLTFDLKIIFLTVFQGFVGKNAY